MAARWCPAPQVRSDAIYLDDLQISFHRTLRVSDGHDCSLLPPSLGRFPLYEARRYANTLPPKMAHKGGAFLAMYRKFFNLRFMVKT